ncbi:MAG: hypothetical protein AAF628_19810 [Planctomycetota bacterium]
MMKHLLPHSLLITATLAVPIASQSYKWNQVDELGIKFQLLDKLERIPLVLGSAHPNLKARYEPADAGDYIWGKHGRFKWNLYVYWFTGEGNAPMAGPKDGPTTGPQGTPPKKEAKEAKAPGRPGRDTNEAALAFGDFVTSKADPGHSKRSFVVKGKKVAKNRGVGVKLPYTWWEYTDERTMSNGREAFGQIWYNCAALYEIDGHEVAVIGTMPVKKGKRLASKQLKWLRRMLQSVSLLKDKELNTAKGADDDEVFAHADTQERRDAIHAARKNIGDLDNWDLVTTPNYIVLYSWEKPEKRKQSRKEASRIGAEMDRMRDLYQEYYPPHDGMDMPYSVLRLCSTREEFNKYGGTGGGVIGWFSPKTKELVLFMGRRDVDTVAFHEGWHQYSNAYFGGVELQRWFDEGHGDFFGSFAWKGRKWRYATSQMRKIDAKVAVTTEDFVPLEEIVQWHKSKFYGPRAGWYYAQGYAMVDFLRNGNKNRRMWNTEWDDILENYRKAVLETKKPEKAVEMAFEGIDWDAFTKAWTAWVKGY